MAVRLGNHCFVSFLLSFVHSADNLCSAKVEWAFPITIKFLQYAFWEINGSAEIIFFCRTFLFGFLAVREYQIQMVSNHLNLGLGQAIEIWLHFKQPLEPITEVFRCHMPLL